MPVALLGTVLQSLPGFASSWLLRIVRGVGTACSFVLSFRLLRASGSDRGLMAALLSLRSVEALGLAPAAARARSKLAASATRTHSSTAQQQHASQQMQEGAPAATEDDRATISVVVTSCHSSPQQPSQERADGAAQVAHLSAQSQQQAACRQHDDEASCVGSLVSSVPSGDCNTSPFCSSSRDIAVTAASILQMQPQDDAPDEEASSGTGRPPCPAPVASAARPWFLWPRRAPQPRTALLPPQTFPQPRMTLVLDLDQTLIECLHLKCERAAEPDFVYTDSHGLQAAVWQRPHLMHFLQSVSKDFEVVLFTAAAQRHADAVLGMVDPSRTLIHHRLYGHHTVAAPLWSWVKDLSRLGRDLSQTLIVDDCSMAALLQPGSWVSIAPFSHLMCGWRDDTALLDILEFLRDKVLPARDVRQAIQQHYDQAACRPYKAALATAHAALAPAPSGLAFGDEGGDGQCGGLSGVMCEPLLVECSSLPSQSQAVSETLRRVQTIRNCLSVATS